MQKVCLSHINTTAWAYTDQIGFFSCDMPLNFQESLQTGKKEIIHNIVYQGAWGDEICDIMNIKMNYQSYQLLTLTPSNH